MFLYCFLRPLPSDPLYLSKSTHTFHLHHQPPDYEEPYGIVHGAAPPAPVIPMRPPWLPCMGAAWAAGDQSRTRLWGRMHGHKKRGELK